MAFTPLSTDGGFTPDANAMLEQCALAAIIWNNYRDGLPRLLAACGGGELLYYYYSPTSFTPCRMVVKQGNNLYVHIGGTNREIIGNIQNIMGAVLSIPWIGAGVFSNSTWTTFASENEIAMRGALPPGWPAMQMTFVGHSQGCCVAYLIGMLWRVAYGLGPFDWLGLASPRCLAGAPSPLASRHRFGYVIINENDAVPCVPPDNALASVSGPGLTQAITLGRQPRWYHVADRWTLHPDGTRTRTILPQSDAPLTPSNLRNVGNYHPFHHYKDAVIRYWRTQRA